MGSKLEMGGRILCSRKLITGIVADSAVLRIKQSSFEEEEGI